jgi:hypothetical protein
MGTFMPDAEISMTAAQKCVQILPRARVRVWSMEVEFPVQMYSLKTERKADATQRVM